MALLSIYYTNAESAKTLFCLCDVKSVEARNYLSTVPPGGPAIKCERKFSGSCANCAQKGFCWCVITSEFTRSRKIACGLSPHTLSQMSTARKHILIGVMSTLLDSQVIGLHDTYRSGPAKHPEIH